MRSSARVKAARQKEKERERASADHPGSSSSSSSRRTRETTNSKGKGKGKKKGSKARDLPPQPNKPKKPPAARKLWEEAEGDGVEDDLGVADGADAHAGDGGGLARHGEAGEEGAGGGGSGDGTRGVARLGRAGGATLIGSGAARAGVYGRKAADKVQEKQELSQGRGTREEEADRGQRRAVIGCETEGDLPPGRSRAPNCNLPR